MEKIIIFCGHQAKVACDEKCNKAWGMNHRPRVYPEISETKIFGLNGESICPENEDIDEDNYAYCADDELGEAPEDPGTYEGFEEEAKPINKVGIPNKWCVRECERCAMSNPGQSHLPLELRDLSKRFYNIAPNTR